MKYVENPKRKEYRLAVVVSKKVHKSAVVRNRIRRRIYEAVRLEAVNMAGAFDIVITIFNDQVATIPSEDITRLVRAQLKQAKITQPSRNAPQSMVE